MNDTLKDAISEELDALSPEDQLRVLEFARALANASPAGVAGRDLLRFAGSMDREELRAMSAAIEEHCERTDRDGW